MSILSQGRVLLSNLERALAERFYIFACTIIVSNLLLSLFVIANVPYTEIDWIAYMQEVSGVLNDKEYDYLKLRGDTGPLVYPAGFVYIFSGLYYLTDDGNNIRKAQYMFAAFQSIVLAFVLSIYGQCYKDQSNRRSFPIWIAVFLLLSRRVMSLFVLRLFNEAVQILFIYAAIAFFIQNNWSIGCLFFSISVSVKMNALLFAPGVAVLLCQACGTRGAIARIFGICLTVQLVLGAPFLLHAPGSYLSRAFELTREFIYMWSVNGAFLPEHIFLDKRLSAALLVVHLMSLLFFGHFKWTAEGEGGLLGLGHLIPDKKQGWLRRIVCDSKQKKLNPIHVANVLLTCNFIGIAFSRTLHYQFYLWYAHSLPLLVYFTNLPAVTKLAVLVIIEVVFNGYPPHAVTALSLHAAHFILLGALWTRPRAVSGDIYMTDNGSN